MIVFFPLQMKRSASPTVAKREKEKKLKVEENDLNRMKNFPKAKIIPESNYKPPPGSKHGHNIKRSADDSSNNETGDNGATNLKPGEGIDYSVIPIIYIRLIVFQSLIFEIVRYV